MPAHSLCAACLLAAALVSPVLAQQAGPRLAKRLPDDRPQYSVAMNLTGRTQEGGTRHIAQPKLIVRDSHPGSVFVGSESPFVTGASKVDAKEAYDPVIHVLRRGVTAEVTVRDIGNGFVTVDVSVDQSEIVDVQLVEIRPDLKVQAPRVETKSSRLIRSVPFNKPFQMEFDSIDPEEGRLNLSLIVRPM